MAINFPSSPTVNQEYTYNNRTWSYNGSGWVIKKITSPTYMDIVTGLGYQPVSISGDTMNGTLRLETDVSSRTIANSTLISIGNTTVNTSINSTSLSTRTIGANTVNSNIINSNTVTSGSIVVGNTTVNSTAIAFNGVVGTSGQVLTSSGPGVPPTWTTISTAAVTSITAGNGLTGGTITTSGTISVDTTTGAIGTYALLSSTSVGVGAAGANVSGTSLIYSSIYATCAAGPAVYTGGGSPAGTWRRMGATGAATNMSLYIRVL